MHQKRIERDSITRDTTVLRAGVVQANVRRAVVPEGREQDTPPDDLRRRIENLKSGSYIDDIIAEQDSALYRWHEKLSDALRVYVEPTSTAAGWDPVYPELARNAFSEWSEAGFPLRFAFVYDSTSADIRIRWKDRFPPSEGQRIGVTERIQTSKFWIANARIDVANHDSTGRLLSTRSVAGILRHEIGHALGLNHSSDATSVMYRESATSMISPSDRATLRLLYLIPPGSLR
jgi:predicted Zn-dependent protease